MTRDVEVWRERLNIDLLASSESNKWVFLVENKIKAKATKRQLLKYIEIVKREFPNFTILPILLTLEEEEDSDMLDEVGYSGWNYSKMIDVLSHVINQRQDRILTASLFLMNLTVLFKNHVKNFLGSLTADPFCFPKKDTRVAIFYALTHFPTFFQPRRYSSRLI